jgi:hypothetical protein
MRLDFLLLLLCWALETFLPLPSIIPIGQSIALSAPGGTFQPKASYSNIERRRGRGANPHLAMGSEL